MPKLTESKMTIKGKSDKEYLFDIFSLTTEFKETGGIYIFSSRYLGKDKKYHHKFIYCGKTNDLSTRFDNHHKKDCIKEHNANCVCIMLVNTERERTEIETDILEGNDFPCNEIHN